MDAPTTATALRDVKEDKVQFQQVESKGVSRLPHGRKQMNTARELVRPTFIDLFAGCGGLSLGLMQAGWHGLFAIEQNHDAFKTLHHNLIEQNTRRPFPNGFDWPAWLEKNPVKIQRFISANRSRLNELRGTVNLVVGGPPCQGFSFAGRRTGDDPRNKLFRYHLRIVRLLQPELALIENVHGINATFTSGRNYASHISEMLGRCGYSVQQHIFKASDYGVPQIRTRFFILGIRNDIVGSGAVPDLATIMHLVRPVFLDKHGLPANSPVTVSEALSDLITEGKMLVDCGDKESPPGFKEIEYKGPESNYQRLMHGNMNGQSINSLRLVNHRAGTVIRFRRIISTCRKGVNISNHDRERLAIRKMSITPLAPDKPSHTLTTLPDDLLHYSEPRVHTVREHARLQSFPDWFEFRGKFTTGGDRRVHECPRYTQVGNAVPPLLAEAIGESLLEIRRRIGLDSSAKREQRLVKLRGDT